MRTIAEGKFTDHWASLNIPSLSIPIYHVNMDGEVS